MTILGTTFLLWHRSRRPFPNVIPGLNREKFVENKGLQPLVLVGDASRALPPDTAKHMKRRLSSVRAAKQWSPRRRHSSVQGAKERLLEVKKKRQAGAIDAARILHYGFKHFELHNIVEEGDHRRANEVVAPVKAGADVGDHPFEREHRLLIQHEIGGKNDSVIGEALKQRFQRRQDSSRPSGHSGYRFVNQFHRYRMLLPVR